MDWSGGQPVPQAEVLRGDEMRTPDEVSGDAAAEGAGVGDQADRAGAWVQPHDGPSLCGGGPVRAVSPPGRAAPCAGRS